MASNVRHGDPATRDSSSPGSGSTHLTPVSDSDDGHNLDGLEAEEGLELTELKSKSPGTYRDRKKEEYDDEDVGSQSDDDEDMALQTGRKARRGPSSVAASELYTPDEERRVLRKLDTRLVLFVALLYMLSFVDRSNIGAANLAGLSTDLKLSDGQYEWLLTAFHATYVCFEWMTLCFKLFPPHIYISLTICAWGVIASLQSLATSWAHLMVLRVLLGIGEAAFVGIPFYLSFFFRKQELGLRVGLFIAAAPLATTFASFLAWAIVRFGSGTGISPWRLLFLIEGFPDCVVSVWAWFWIPDSPGTAKWLSTRERKIAVLRMRKESSTRTNLAEKPVAHISSAAPAHKRKFQWGEVLTTLRDPKAYITAGMFFFCNVSFSSFPVFLPIIISSMGFSTLAAQGLAAPPFMSAFFVVLLTAWISDRLQSRSAPMMFHALLALGGYLISTLAGMYHAGPALRYAATFPICAGFFSCVTIVITWSINNQASEESRGAGLAILQVGGQLGPLVGVRLFPSKDGPYYIPGMAVCAGAMAMVFVLALALRIVLIRENKRGRARWKEAEGEGLVGRKRVKQFVYLT